MKATIYAIIATAAIVGIIGATVSANKGAAGNIPAFSEGILNAATDNFDFGTISMSDGPVTNRYEVTNRGSEPVVITKVYTSCMCTEASIWTAEGELLGTFGMSGHGGPTDTRVVVAAGESVYIDAVYDPAAHGPSGVGYAQRSVYIESNSTTSPTLELRLKATVTL